MLPVIIALFATALLNRPVKFLRRRGLGPGIASFVAMFVAVAAVTALVVLVAPGWRASSGRSTTGCARASPRSPTASQGGPLELSRGDIDRAVDRAQDQIGADSGAIGRRVLSGALLVGELIAGALLALVLTFFFLKDGEQMWRWLTEFFSDPLRHDLRQIGDRGWDTLAATSGGWRWSPCSTPR